MEAARVIKRRVEHLKEAENLPEEARPLWQKKRLDRMLVEFFLRAGYYNTALKLARHSEIEVHFDLLFVKVHEHRYVNLAPSSADFFCYNILQSATKSLSALVLNFSLMYQKLLAKITGPNRILPKEISF